jgi:ketosteroid isomerase-like protein
MRLAPLLGGVFGIALAGASTPRIVSAQLPGESAHTPRVSLRAEYLKQTYAEVQQFLAEWVKDVDDGDVPAVRRMLADQAYFSPAEGWIAQGQQEVVDSLTSFLPRVSAYGIAVQDFDASATLAYVMSSVYYQLAHGTERRVVNTDAMILLARAGARWQVRSYLERESNSAR